MMIEERSIGGASLELAAAEELAGRLAGEGWAVERAVGLEGACVDLVARRGGETVFYEFKIAGLPQADDWAVQLVALQQLAKRHGAAFRLVMVRPPRQMELEIDGIGRMLFESFLDEPPWQVADMAGHTLIDDVDDVDLTSVFIRGTTAQVTGEASLGVTLQTGSGELVSSESFPFTFSATLDLKEGRAEEVEVHEVDTTSWYGDEEGGDNGDTLEEDVQPDGGDF